MKPRSIRIFGYLYLGSALLALVNYFAFENAALDELDADGLFAGFGSTFATVVLGFSLAITFLLWWLVSARRSKVAKWIIVVLFVTGLLSALGALALYQGVSLAIMIVAWIMYAGAVVCLFLPDAKAYLDGYESNPDVFS